MPLAFEPITLAGQTRYKAVLAACPAPTSDYTFANLWGWRDHYGLTWAFDQDLVWIRQTLPAPVLWAPVGNWAAARWPREDLPPGLALSRVPAPLLGVWKDVLGLALDARPARDHFDYVYASRELIELKGNKFHKKKNLLAQFTKNYVYDYQPMTPECVESVLDMQENWCRWNECEAEALIAENAVIHRVLTSFDRIEELTGGALWVDGRIIAYTVAERLPPDMLVIHFEKGDIRYKGVYQAINRMFLEHAATDIPRVNREQDLGDAGLRKAKLSYNPSEFLEKYDVTVTGWEE